MSPRLFWSIVSMEARKQMSYRADFWLNSVAGFVASLGVVYFLWSAIFEESGSEVIGGYTFNEMVIYYILVLLLGQVVRVSRMGETGVSEEIYEGGLTRYIIYPVHFFAFKYAQRLGRLLPPLIQLVLLGSVSYLLAPEASEVRFQLQSVLMAIVTVAVGNLLAFVIVLPVEAIAFWQDHVWSLFVMLFILGSFLGGLMIPLSVFPDWLRSGLMVTPFPYLYNFPVNVLMGKVPPSQWLIGLLVAGLWIIGLSMLLNAVWRRGQLRYTGVGI